MNLAKLVDLVEEFNSKLGTAKKNSRTPILYIEVESSKVFYLFALGMQIWDSETNDTYTNEGELLSMEHFIIYELKKFVSLSEQQNKRINDYFSNQLELEL